jgi:DNA-binding NarL/FixJ family response regulator
MRFSSIEQGGQIAVVIEPARPEEMAPLLLSAYALTDRERNIAQYVLRGMSNKVIGRALSVSPLTVQQHLKAIFEKMGVHSRGELTGRVMVEYHRERLPGLGAA